MMDQFLNFVAKEYLFQPEDRILLAVSGGMDSVVMAELFHRAGFTFAIAHCNFQLRGDESDRDELFVRSLAAKHGVPFFVEHYNTNSFARKNKLSIQVAARNLRYDWFEKLLSEEGYDYIATAHHLDDQVETFLINMARGTGIAGLHGILPKQGRVIRPMLFASRMDIEKFAKENNIGFVEDSSNASDKYTRNRIRHRIIPQFEKINPSFHQNILETIGKIRDVESVYNEIVSNEKKRLLFNKGGVTKVPIGQLKQLVPLQTWAFEILSEFGFTLAVVRDIIEALDGQAGKKFFSATHQLVKDRDLLIISPIQTEKKQVQYEVYPVPADDLPIRLIISEQDWPGPGMSTDPFTALVDRDKISFPLTIRKWRRGDYFFPLGMKNKKKLSDFFIDLKYSLHEKDNTWLLCSGKEIVWVIGARLDDRFKVTEQTRRIIQLHWSRGI